MTLDIRETGNAGNGRHERAIRQDVVHPGAARRADQCGAETFPVGGRGADAAAGHVLLRIIPNTVVVAFATGEILQVLLLAGPFGLGQSRLGQSRLG